MITSNIDKEDGLFYGAIGVLKDVSTNKIRVILFTPRLLPLIRLY